MGVGVHDRGLDVGLGVSVLDSGIDAVVGDDAGGGVRVLGPIEAWMRRGVRGRRMPTAIFPGGKQVVQGRRILDVFPRPVGSAALVSRSAPRAQAIGRARKKSHGLVRRRRPTQDAIPHGVAVGPLFNGHVGVINEAFIFALEGTGPREHSRRTSL